MTQKQNKVFIATSLDGYIADVDGGIDWLDTFPEINTVDTGYNSFIDEVDALVMGRLTLEKVLSFGMDWPYKLPVFVVSNSMSSVPEDLVGKVRLINGPLKSILQEIQGEGFSQLYIDGGTLIQSFLKEDLIDEMVITVIPILLGKGIPLFKELNNSLVFECFQTKHFINKVVQIHYRRIR